MANVSTIVQLQRQILDYTTYLYNEAYLDDQFKNLQKLQDDLSNPNFVVETVSNFFINFERTVLNITTALHQQLIDWKKVEILIFSLKGSTSSIGAHRLHEACIVLLEHYNQQNIQGCFDSVQKMHTEYFFVKNKLETLLKLHNELIAAGGSIPRQ
ncbi:histidine-containing phosphotransfer protein 1-like [Apium graveolens]|uniref:histidine-containing phosphotransfer protein 1-like n=1 Tax=Apium graveolens TaxID=4045 RepID=UPI003D7A9591